MKTSLLFTLALCCAGAAHAQTIWRCGAEGRTYSDTPCAEGRLVVASDTRDAGQRQAAHDVLLRERALAREMVDQRRQRERDWRAAGTGAAGIQPAPKAEPKLKPKPAKGKPKAKNQRPAADGTWRAIAQVTR